MDALQQIRKPIEVDMERYGSVFDENMQSSTPILHAVLQTLARRKGKMMRPMLTLLSARLAAGVVTDKTINAAVAFEFFHTASLIHDDIVDESDKRRGQQSVNAANGNRVAVLVGDFILATALRCAALTEMPRVIGVLSEAAQKLACGELLQLDTVAQDEVSEQVYLDIIRNKTAALFAACGEAGVLSVSSDKLITSTMRAFGEHVGICFQIRDDIFDYYQDSQIGKPTGNDMREGKLTLPVIHALLATKNAEMMVLAHRVKAGDASAEEIAVLVDFTKQNGGIEYAEQVMADYAEKAKRLLDRFPASDVKQALGAYVDFVIGRQI